MVRQTSQRKLPEGVRVRENAVQINFIDHHGKRRWITLPNPATVEGIRAAYNTRAELINKKQWGVLTDDDINLACGILPELSDTRPTFADYAQMYLDNLNSDNVSTRSKYKGILTNHWMPAFALMAVEDITPAIIRQRINELSFNTEKTFNNALIPLRGVFELAFEDEVIDDLPTKRIKNKKFQEEEPDPFTEDEMTKLLGWIKENASDIMLYWYFEVAFWTGARPSEMIALLWSDVDLEKGTMSITKGRVRGILQNKTKTSKSRLVYLNDNALSAFKNARALNRGNEYVFVKADGSHWNHESNMRSVMRSATQATHIRHRPAYNTRHTYATILLMNGINPAFAANQLGHSLLMFTKIYSRWIHGEQSRNEINKLNK